MRVTNILHALGAFGCIGGIIGLHNAGWVVWQWPAIALLWLINSYINAWSAHRNSTEVQRLHKDLIYNIEQLAKADTRTWEAETYLAKLVAEKQLGEKINLVK